MNDTTATPLIRKIRAILAKANHYSTPPEEALTFHEKARALMLQYEIDPSTLEERDATGEYVAIMVPLPSGVAAWQVQLMQMAGEMYFRECFVDEFPLEKATCIILFGAKRHVEIVESFGAYLLLAVKRKLDLVLEHGGKLDRLTKAEGFASSFKDAAALRLSRRIKEIIAARKGPAAVGSNLPVPLDLAAKAKQALNDLLGGEATETHKSAKIATTNALGAIMGLAAGDEIGLDPQLEGAGRPAGLIGEG